MGACTIGDVSQDFRPVLELNPVHTIRKRLNHDPLHEWGALGHERRLYQRLILPGWPLPPAAPGTSPQAGRLEQLLPPGAPRGAGDAFACRWNRLVRRLE